jgi:hypothetical protein
MGPEKPDRPGTLPVIRREPQGIVYVLSIDRRKSPVANLLVRCDDDGGIYASLSGVAEPCNRPDRL